MKDRIEISGLLIAAGLSSRVGIPKALLEIGSISFITIITLKMLSVCRRVFITLGYESEKIKSKFLYDINRLRLNELAVDIDLGIGVLELEKRVEFVINPQYENGMFTSLKCGLSSCVNSDWILYHFIDQPTIPLQFYKEHYEQVEDSIDWIQPVIKGERGHPIYFSRNVSRMILDSKEAVSLRGIKNQIPNKYYWECTYPEILVDIDTMKDYNTITCK